MIGEKQDSNARQSRALPAGDTQWLAPARLLCTMRSGGVSEGAYAANNLALHVEDDPQKVAINRAQLADLYELKSVQWLNQVHGTTVLAVPKATSVAPTADAMFTTARGVGLAILTADCLPVALVDVDGEVAAIAHAGWRGPCAGILQRLIESLPVSPDRLRGFIGPAIGVRAFEVGVEVVHALENYGLDVAAVSSPSTGGIDTQGLAGKFQVDLARAARLDLQRLGVSDVQGGHWCTAEDPRFYSWRRETHRAKAAGELPATGRQATVIWLPA